MSPRTFLPRFAACLLAVAAAWSAPASAQSDRPLRILVGYPAGGTADLAARLVGDKLRETLNQTVVIENKPGAGGRLVMDYARTQPADGNTLVVANSAVMTIAPLVYRKLNYDIQRDFTPVAQAANFQLALATGPGSPARTLKDYVAWLKAGPQNNSYASPALGSIPHFFGLMIGKQVGIDMLHVPFNGSAPLMSALVGGQVPASVDTLADLTEMHRAGKIRVLATSGTHRSVALPDVPTFTELGYKDIEGEGRYGLLAPAGTPRPVLDKLNAAIVKAVQSPDVREKFLKLGLEPATGPADAFAGVLKADAGKWAPVVKASGYTGD
ncbi:Bug family tripartite tricarboxylate transporter substrate binding protein [Cupriavidus necator]|uniref:ABC transporter substrate-binding protein n=1 Tax=Cupriavidus necator TaxID=106590 RepID=A0A367PP82_CUPNE|nr:Bug family tripartite tricarboxylate transporter substrate binding protein [Cupriavidus necator]QQX88800.1 Bug family tripartite tricarboxylate transporter substrate binding protein [Cupriavidus necator]RCJ09701.1 ABC transporter substrate-binding protein [Cupriavidus necator]